MATKPSLYPDWSVTTGGLDNDVTDGTTGQNNVVEPSAAKKLTGFLYNEKPPRQHFNWLFRILTQWVRWFDQEVDSNTDLLADVGQNINTAVSDAGLTPDITDTDLLSQAIGLGGVPRNYINGLYIGVPAALTTSIDIGEGVARSYSNDVVITLSSTFSKLATSNWVAGDGNGGFPSTLTITNNTYYHVFILKNPTTGDVDAGFDSDLSATNLLADATGYTEYRRVGTLLWLTSAFDRIRRVPNSDIYLLDAYRSETLNLTSISGGYLATSQLGPNDFWCEYIAGASAPGDTGIYGIITNGEGGNGTPSEDYHDVGNNASGVLTSVTKKRVVHDPSANPGKIVFNFNATGTTGTVTAFFFGWVDKRDET